MPRDSVITVPLLRRSSSGGGNRVAVLDHLVIYRLIWEGALIYIRATSPFPSGYDVLTTASVITGMDCGLGLRGYLRILSAPVAFVGDLLPSAHN